MKYLRPLICIVTLQLLFFAGVGVTVQAQEISQEIPLAEVLRRMEVEGHDFGLYIVQSQGSLPPICGPFHRENVEVVRDSGPRTIRISGEVADAKVELLYRSDRQAIVNVTSLSSVVETVYTSFFLVEDSGLDLGHSLIFPGHLATACFQKNEELQCNTYVRGDQPGAQLSFGDPSLVIDVINGEWQGEICTVPGDSG